MELSGKKSKGPAGDANTRRPQGAAIGFSSTEHVHVPGAWRQRLGIADGRKLHILRARLLDLITIGPLPIRVREATVPGSMRRPEGGSGDAESDGFCWDILRRHRPASFDEALFRIRSL